MRRLETKLSVRLLRRTTRSVAPTEAGLRLMERLTPALAGVEAALDVVNGFRDRPAGTLRLNVPVSAARLVLPTILPGFLALYPEIQLEVVANDGFVDVLAAGCDAGIRYDERLEQDMIVSAYRAARQRLAVAAAPAYLARSGVPTHPRDLLQHACLRGRFGDGALMSPWEFTREGEVVRIEPQGPLTVSIGGAMDLAVDAGSCGRPGSLRCLKAGLIRAPGVALMRSFTSAAGSGWASFPGPFLYYSGFRLVPPPLRAFLDFIKAKPFEQGCLPRS